MARWVPIPLAFLLGPPPWKWWLPPLQPAPGLSFFRTGQGRAPGGEGAPEETGCKGRGEKGGARTTQVHSSLFSPTTLACNSPNHLGTLKYTPPPAATFFAIRSVAPGEPCSTGEAGEVGGGGTSLSLSRARASSPTHPTITSLRNRRQLCKGHSASEARGGGRGGGRPPAHRKQTAARRAGALGRPAAGPGPGPGMRSRRAGQRPGGPSRGRPGRHLRWQIPGPTDRLAAPPFPRA